MSRDALHPFIERLRQRLAGRLPGESAQYLMAPPRRGRPDHALSMKVPQREGAVLLYLFPQRGDWHTVLMKRPAYPGVHGGQVSIPGGRLEPGEDHRQAALREFEEETGVAVPGRQLIGSLSELFIPVSHFRVRPFVAYAMQRPCFSPDPTEVEEIIELVIPSLMSDSTVRCGRVCLSSGESVEAPYFDVDGHRVWGATAMILSELKEILRSMT
jgi:8-oxo-dGTP pyrophosphatase MutT (NUDIX family)